MESLLACDGESGKLKKDNGDVGDLVGDATNRETLQSLRSCAVQCAGEVNNDVKDLVDAGGNTGGLEELAEAWTVLGALESADYRPLGHLGTLE